MEHIVPKIFTTKGQQKKKIRLSNVLTMEVARDCLGRGERNQQLVRKLEDYLPFIREGEKYIVIIRRTNEGKILFHEFSYEESPRGTIREVSESHSVWNATGFIFS